MDTWQQLDQPESFSGIFSSWSWQVGENTIDTQSLGQRVRMYFLLKLKSAFCMYNQKLPNTSCFRKFLLIGHTNLQRVGIYPIFMTRRQVSKVPTALLLKHNSKMSQKYLLLSSGFLPIWKWDGLLRQNMFVRGHGTRDCKPLSCTVRSKGYSVWKHQDHES